MTETSSKFFSLIHGQQVAISPGTKKVSGADLATLVDAKELLDAVQEDAKSYRKQVIQECEAIKEQAVAEGFQAGYEKWADQVAQLEKEIQQVREELQKVVMPVAISAAKKIVTEELAISPEVTKKIVANTLKTVAQHKRIVLYVSKQDFQMIESEKNELKKIFEELESLSVRERDDIEPGGCVIETEIGIVNARLQDRWRTLEAAFESLFSRIKGAQDGA